MADLQAYVLTCTPERVTAVIQILASYGLGLDWGSALDGNETDLHLATAYVGSGNSAWDLADELIHDVPDVMFRAWTDPDEDGLGEGVLHLPGRASFRYTSDSDGDALFRPAEIREALQQGGVDQLDELFGDAHRRALAAAEHAAQNAIVRAWRCELCGDLECERTCPVGQPACERRACESHTVCETAAAQEDEAHALNAAIARGVLVAPDAPAADARELIAALAAGTP